MNDDVLLDTSVVIPYLKKDVAVGRQLRASSVLYLPSVVLGELYCGAYQCVHRAKPLAEIKNFLTAVAILSVGEATSDHTVRSGRPWPRQARRSRKMIFGLRHWLRNINCRWLRAIVIFRLSPG